MSYPREMPCASRGLFLPQYPPELELKCLLIVQVMPVHIETPKRYEIAKGKSHWLVR